MKTAKASIGSRLPEDMQQALRRLVAKAPQVKAAQAMQIITPGVQATPEDSSISPVATQDSNNEETAKIRQLKAHLKFQYGVVHDAKLLVAKALSHRTIEAKTKGLRRAITVLETAKVRGLGRAHKTAITEIRGMVDEAVLGNKHIADAKYLQVYADSIKSKYKTAGNKLKAFKVTDLDDTAIAILHNLHTSKHETKLNMGNREFHVARLPIIPVVNGVFYANKLRNIKTENLGSYTLLADQMVVGISKDADISEVLEDLNTVTRKKLMLVTGKAARRKGALWYWVADKTTVNELMRGGNGSFKVRDWDFAF